MDVEAQRGAEALDEGDGSGAGAGAHAQSGVADQAQISAGGCNGTEVLAFALSEGREAGKAAAAACGHRKRGGTALPKIDVVEMAPIRLLWTVPARYPNHRLDKHFVDFQNDVTAADIGLAAREGYRSVEHLKRYTTTGMGTDQGKTSNVNALAILAETLGADISATGTTTFRPPYAELRRYARVNLLIFGVNQKMGRRVTGNTTAVHPGA